MGIIVLIKLDYPPPRGQPRAEGNQKASFVARNIPDPPARPNEPSPSSSTTRTRTGDDFAAGKSGADKNDYGATNGASTIFHRNNAFK